MAHATDIEKAVRQRLVEIEQRLAAIDEEVRTLNVRKNELVSLLPDPNKQPSIQPKLPLAHDNGMLESSDELREALEAYLASNPGSEGVVIADEFERWVRPWRGGRTKRKTITDGLYGLCRSGRAVRHDELYWLVEDAPSEAGAVVKGVSS